MSSGAFGAASSAVNAIRRGCGRLASRLGKVAWAFGQYVLWPSLTAYGSAWQYQWRTAVRWLIPPSWLKHHQYDPSEDGASQQAHTLRVWVISLLGPIVVPVFILGLSLAANTIWSAFCVTYDVLWIMQGQYADRTGEGCNAESMGQDKRHPIFRYGFGLLGVPVGVFLGFGLGFLSSVWDSIVHLHEASRRYLGGMDMQGAAYDAAQDKRPILVSLLGLPLAGLPVLMSTLWTFVLANVYACWRQAFPRAYSVWMHRDTEKPEDEKSYLFRNSSGEKQSYGHGWLFSFAFWAFRGLGYVLGCVIGMVVGCLANQLHSFLRAMTYFVDLLVCTKKPVVNWAKDQRRGFAWGLGLIGAVPGALCGWVLGFVASNGLSAWRAAIRFYQTYTDDTFVPRWMMQRSSVRERSGGVMWFGFLGMVLGRVIGATFAFIPANMYAVVQLSVLTHNAFTGGSCAGSGARHASWWWFAPHAELSSKKGLQSGNFSLEQRISYWLLRLPAVLLTSALVGLSAMLMTMSQSFLRQFVGAYNGFANDKFKLSMLSPEHRPAWSRRLGDGLLGWVGYVCGALAGVGFAFTHAWLVSFRNAYMLWTNPKKDKGLCAELKCLNYDQNHSKFTFSWRGLHNTVFWLFAGMGRGLGSVLGFVVGGLASNLYSAHRWIDGVRANMLDLTQLVTDQDDSASQNTGDPAVGTVHGLHVMDQRHVAAKCGSAIGAVVGFLLGCVWSFIWANPHGASQGFVWMYNSWANDLRSEHDGFQYRNDHFVRMDLPDVKKGMDHMSLMTIAFWLFRAPGVVLGGAVALPIAFLRSTWFSLERSVHFLCSGLVEEQWEISRELESRRARLSALLSGVGYVIGGVLGVVFGLFGTTIATFWQRIVDIWSMVGDQRDRQPNDLYRILFVKEAGDRSADGLPDGWKCMVYFADMTPNSNKMVGGTEGQRKGDGHDGSSDIERTFDKPLARPIFIAKTLCYTFIRLPGNLLGYAMGSVLGMLHASWHAAHIVFIECYDMWTEGALPMGMDADSVQKMFLELDIYDPKAAQPKGSADAEAAGFQIASNLFSWLGMPGMALGLVLGHLAGLLATNWVSFVRSYRDCRAYFLAPTLQKPSEDDAVGTKFHSRSVDEDDYDQVDAQAQAPSRHWLSWLLGMPGELLGYVPYGLYVIAHQTICQFEMTAGALLNWGVARPIFDGYAKYDDKSYNADRLIIAGGLGVFLGGVLGGAFAMTVWACRALLFPAVVFLLALGFLPVSAAFKLMGKVYDEFFVSSERASLPEVLQSVRKQVNWMGALNRGSEQKNRPIFGRSSVPSFFRRALHWNEPTVTEKFLNKLIESIRNNKGGDVNVLTDEMIEAAEKDLKKEAASQIDSIVGQLTTSPYLVYQAIQEVTDVADHLRTLNLPIYTENDPNPPPAYTPTSVSIHFRSLWAPGRAARDRNAYVSVGQQSVDPDAEIAAVCQK